MARRAEKWAHIIRKIAYVCVLFYFFVFFFILLLLRRTMCVCESKKKSIIILYITSFILFQVSKKAKKQKLACFIGFQKEKNKQIQFSFVFGCNGTLTLRDTNSVLIHNLYMQNLLYTTTPSHSSV